MTGLRIYKKIVDILADIIYVMILLYAFVAIPYLFGYTPMVVLSGSMQEAYSKGSIIYYSETSKESLKEGDVITFFYDGKEDNLITHRINKIDGDEYITKGDENPNVDEEKIKFSNIKGKVAKVYIPYLGFVVNYIKKHVYLIVIAALILIAEFILNNLKIFNKKKQKKKQEDPEVQEFIENEKGASNAIEENKPTEIIEMIEVDEPEEEPTPVDDLDLPALKEEPNDNKEE